MSRVGKKFIQVPVGVQVKMNGSAVEVTGPKGVLKRETFGRIAVNTESDKVFVTSKTGQNSSAYWGLYRALISNMVIGVSSGYTKGLEIQGTGYRATLEGKNLALTLGFSHPVHVKPPLGINFEVDKTGKVFIFGIDKELVGQMAATIRAIRPAEPYQGKGIRHVGEVIKTKVGKSATKK